LKRGGREERKRRREGRDLILRGEGGEKGDKEKNEEKGGRREGKNNEMRGQRAKEA
jgi:hypothetical protein